MAKTRQKRRATAAEPVVPQAAEVGTAVDTAKAEVVADAVAVDAAASVGATADAVPAMVPAKETAEEVVGGRPIRYRWMADLIKVVAALCVVVLAGFVWYQPPLTETSFPHLTYTFEGKEHRDATLYRPAAMPARYYVALPQRLAGHYKWFVIDRRREVVALTSEPKRRAIGGMAIRRSDPLGLDLEFRKIDGSEWQIHFMPDKITFSNAVLSVSLDAQK